MPRTRNLILVTVLLPVLWPPFSMATTSAEKEIQHLFEFISQSGCTFIRNDKEYTALDARDHMQKKYAYAKRWIDNTDHFIDHIASKSSISGKRYQVRCEEHLFYSDNWLQQELARYRASQSHGQRVSVP